MKRNWWVLNESHINKIFFHMTLTLILPTHRTSIIICFVKKKFFLPHFEDIFFASSQMEVKSSHFYGWNFFMYTICITHTVIHKEFLLHNFPYCFANKLEKSVYPEHWIMRNFIKFLLTPFGSRPVIKFHYHEKIFPFSCILARNGERNDFFSLFLLCQIFFVYVW